MRPSTLRIPLQGGKTLAHRLVKASQNPSFLSGKKTGLHCSHKLIGLRFKAPNVDFVVVISKDLAHPWIGGHNFLRWLTSSKNKNLVEPFRRKTKYDSVLFMLQILTPSLHVVGLGKQVLKIHCVAPKSRDILNKKGGETWWTAYPKKFWKNMLRVTQWTCFN